MKKLFLLFSLSLFLCSNVSAQTSEVELRSIADCTPLNWREIIGDIDDRIHTKAFRQHVYFLLNHTKNLRGHLTREERVLRDRANSLVQEVFVELTSLLRDSPFYVSCGTGVDGCEEISTGSVSARVVVLLEELHIIVTDLVSHYRRALTRLGITGKANTRRWRPILRSADTLKDNITFAISSLPATVYACDFS